jgi:hypothetical protein
MKSKTSKGTQKRQAGPFQPGNEFRWKPGESGNPKGRTPNDVKQIAREFGEQYDPKMGKTRDEHLMGLLYRKGCQGNLKAAELWLAYRWGRPIQQQVNLNIEPTKEEKIAAMSDEELHQRLAELLTARNQNGGSVV